MAQHKKPGLKSAFDLAMERLEKKDGRLAALSDEQKKALAEIDRQAQAKVAEIEILMAKSLAQAREKDDPDEMKKIEEQKNAAMAKVRAAAEADKDRIRKGG